MAVIVQSWGMVCGWTRTLYVTPVPIISWRKPWMSVATWHHSCIVIFLYLREKWTICECISHRNGKIKYMRAVYLRTIIKELCSLWKRSLNVEFVNYVYSQGSQGGTGGKEPACQCRRHKRGGFDPWVDKEEEMAAHSSILAWWIPWTEKPGWLQSIGSHRVGHEWRSWAHMCRVRKSLVVQCLGWHFLCWGPWFDPW